MILIIILIIIIIIILIIIIIIINIIINIIIVIIIIIVVRVIAIIVIISIIIIFIIIIIIIIIVISIMSVMSFGSIRIGRKNLSFEMPKKMKMEARQVSLRNEKNPFVYGEHQVAWLSWLVLLAGFLLALGFILRLRRKPLRTVGTQTRESKESLSRYTIEALRAELGSMDCAKGGTKDVIIERLMRMRAMREDYGAF